MSYKTSEEKRKYANDWYHANRDRLLAERKEKRAQSDATSTEAVRKWRAANPERAKAIAQENYRKEVDTRVRLARNLKKLYGITLADYDYMFIMQGGGCAICKQEMTPPHVDHDHHTGKVRGLLCTQHNVLLGMAQDSPEILEAAAAYIRSKKD